MDFRNTKKTPTYLQGGQMGMQKILKGKTYLATLYKDYHKKKFSKSN